MIHHLHNTLSIIFLILMISLVGCGGGGGSSGNSNNTVSAPTLLSYTSPQTYTIGIAITPIVPTVTGTVTSYSVSPDLPAGLTLNANTGQISGVPSVVIDTAKNYVITAQNSGGSTIFNLAIVVLAPPPPTALFYISPQAYTLGTAITPMNPTVTGTVTSYSVSPDLPAGLTLNANTGQISGIPTVVLDTAKNYVVTAQNSGGSTTFSVAITVHLASPIVTVSYGIKQVILNWGTVIGASHYKVFKRVSSESIYTQIDTDIVDTSFTDHVAVHLTDWLNTSYKVVACNDDSSCTDSAIVSAKDHDKAIGFFKASNAEQGDFFGSSVALSADGNTLAVGAEQESSSAVGINGDQTDNSSATSGAIYVFTRSTSGTWTQQAYIKPLNTNANSRFGSSLALSANGDTLAIGARQDNNVVDYSGAVYVYTRIGTTWSQQVYIKASNPDQTDYFGATVSLSADGNILAVGAFGEDSNATGINGNQLNNSAQTAGAAYVYTRVAGTWSQQAYIKASNTREYSFFGNSVALSADGNTLAVGAYCEQSAATGVNGNQFDQSANCSGAVYIYTQLNNIWSQQSYIKASNTEGGDDFGLSVALSADGNTLAVGAIAERSAATGINGDESNNDKISAGAAYVFVRSGSNWVQESYIKSSNTKNSDWFGASLALSADGNTLVVGANFVDTYKGAAYIYLRSNSVWKQNSIVRSSQYKSYSYSNQIFFGDSVALSADGNTLAVGAHAEGSTTTGIGAPSQNHTSINSGAVYLY